MRRNHTNLFPVIFSLIFGIVGLSLLISGIAVMRSSLRFQSTAVEVTGVITDITSYRDSDGDLEHEVLVSYSYGGQDFQNARINFYSSNMYVGKEIKLSVDPSNPGHMTSKSGDTIAYIMLIGMGLLFTIIGVVPLITMLVRRISSKKLENNGQVLYATVERIDINPNVTVNGRHPHVIYCTYWDAYKDVTYRFKSKNLFSDPGMDYPPGSTIEVYVNPDDYSKYTVKTDSKSHSKMIDYT